jgi:uncharacterized protein
MRDIPGPRPDPETQAWWDACKAGRLLVRHCDACGENHFLPRSICPFCFSQNTGWREASGAATIYSFSVVRRPSSPYVLAYVTLDEGPTMMTNIKVGEPDILKIGQRVRVAFEPTDTGFDLPVFAPV